VDHFYIDPDSGLQIIVERERDYCVAEVRELPGCVGEGQTIDEALEEVTAALDAILEVIRQDEPDRYADLLHPVVSSRSVDGHESTAGTMRLCFV
jgi:predicted RNase H-like HicB family nuclease